MTFEERKQEALEHVKADNYIEAFKLFSVLYYENPKDLKSLEMISFLFDRINEGHYDFEPATAEEYISRGVAKFYKGESANSIEDYNRAIKLNPKADYAYKCKAFSLMFEKKYLLAIEELKKAIGIKEYGEYYDDIAENLSRAGMNEEAIAYHEKAIQVSPNDARLWYNYGTHLGDMNMIANAVLKFQKAIDLFPNYDDAKHNLNYYLQKLKNL